MSRSSCQIEWPGNLSIFLAKCSLPVAVLHLLPTVPPSFYFRSEFNKTSKVCCFTSDPLSGHKGRQIVKNVPVMQLGISRAFLVGEKKVNLFIYLYILFKLPAANCMDFLALDLTISSKVPAQL
jgi:hypothetical protein